MSGLSGWQLSHRLEARAIEHLLDLSSLKMVASFRRDMWGHPAAYLIAQTSVANQVPIVVVSALFTQKLMPSRSPRDMESQLLELISTVPIAPVEIVLDSSLMLVSVE